MDAFVQILILACLWEEGAYVAFQSTATQWWMDVYLKRVSDLTSAMSANLPWIKQSYRLPWTQVLLLVLLDPRGIEVILWTNDYRNERGLTVGYRRFENPTMWTYAQVDVPGLHRRTMQLTYLRWGYQFEDYATDFYSETDILSNELPFFYAPRSASIDDVWRWAVDDAIDNEYGPMVPWIRRAIEYYCDTRWREASSEI